MPPRLGVPADELIRWLDDLAERVIRELHVDLSRLIPDGVPLRRDGRPVTESAVDRILTLPHILAEEERLLVLVEARLAQGGADARIAGVDDLDGPQRELAAAVAGDRQIVLAVGPAGTGKTTALRPVVDHLRREGRAVFGTAPSATAAEVLGTDAGVDADTIDKLLVEHALDRPPDHRYDLPAGATVIVDEAAMVSTPRLVDLVELAGRSGWRLALVGDPLQFSAVGRAGMFDHLVATHGAIELEQVHRFNAPWEREASLRLRRGDTTVVDLYDQQGRIHGGTASQMRRAVVDSWWQATLKGQRAAMMAPTTAAVEELNIEAQRRRIDAGQLDATGPAIDESPYRLHVGDQIATRRNNRRLVTDRHLMVKNRDHWTIDAIGDDGSLAVSGRNGTARLPADYVAEHVEFAYAETSHANQGRTVDRSFLFLDGPTDTRGVYVPLTRGRHSNEAFVVTRSEETAVDVLTEALTRAWIDRPAVTVRAEMQRPDTSGSTADGDQPGLGGPELRRLLERRHELADLLYRSTAGLNNARRLVAQAAHDGDRLRASIAGHETRLADARGTIAAYDRPLLRCRHARELDTARNQLEWVPRAIAGDQAKLAVVERQESRAVELVRDSYTLSKRRPELLAEQSIVQHHLREDVQARGNALAMEPPPLLVDRLGPVPSEPTEAERWRTTAGHVAQHREAFEWNGPGLLEPEPPMFSLVDAYVSSLREARHAIEHLDRGQSRGLEVEPPHRELGIELSL